MLQTLHEMDKVSWRVGSVEAMKWRIGHTFVVLNVIG